MDCKAEGLGGDVFCAVGVIIRGRQPRRPLGCTISWLQPVAQVIVIDSSLCSFFFGIGNNLPSIIRA